MEIVEAKEIVQRFSVSIVKGMTSGSNIRMKIEFSDFAVARNLQVAVDDWVAGLETKKIPFFYRFMERRSEFMTAFIPYAFAAACLFGFSRSMFSSNIATAISSLLSALAISVVMFSVGTFLNTQFYRQLQIVKPLTFLKFTSGDENRCSKVSRMVTGRKWLMAFIGVTVVSGVFINIFSTYLIEWLRS